MRKVNVVVPGVAISQDILERFASYRDHSGRPLLSIAREGVDSQTADAWGEQVANWVRLAAAIKYFEENPNDGLAAFDIAWALVDIGHIDEAVEVLNSFGKAGCPGCYGDVWWENPDFIAGWILADAGRVSDAVERYKLALSQDTLADKHAIYAHLASVFHQMDRVDDANELYQKAIDGLREQLSIEAADRDKLEYNRKMMDLLLEMLARTKERRPLPQGVLRSEDGLLDVREH